MSLGTRKPASARHSRAASARRPGGPERQSFDDHQIDVRVRSGVATRVRAEQDHLIRVHFIDDDLHHPLQERIVSRVMTPPFPLLVP